MRGLPTAAAARGIRGGAPGEKTQRCVPLGNAPSPCGNVELRQNPVTPIMLHVTTAKGTSQPAGSKALGQNLGPRCPSRFFSLDSQISDNTDAHPVFKSRRLLSTSLHRGPEERRAH